MPKRNFKAVLNLAREYCGENKLKWKNLRLTRRVDFEGIARHQNVNIMLYEPKKNARSVWQLVFGKIQHKKWLAHNRYGTIEGSLVLQEEDKLKHVLNSSKKVFYGDDTKYSYTPCQ